jgi:hypothetical protein
MACGITFILGSYSSNSDLKSALNDLSIALSPWYARRKDSSARALMSVGSFCPVEVRECWSIPFTMASARLPWWLIFSRFCIITEQKI